MNPDPIYTIGDYVVYEYISKGRGKGRGQARYKGEVLGEFSKQNDGMESVRSALALLYWSDEIWRRAVRDFGHDAIRDYGRPREMGSKAKSFWYLVNRVKWVKIELQEGGNIRPIPAIDASHLNVNIQA